MGFPRDYLDFTTWYLVKKGFILKADNSDFTLTAEGVDFIETQRTNLPVLNRLLTDGKDQFVKSSRNQKTPSNGSAASHGANGSKAIILPATTSVWLDRRQTGEDRRRGAIVLAITGIDRRAGTRDRRVNTSDRRQRQGDRRAYSIVNVQDDTKSIRVQ